MKEARIPLLSTDPTAPRHHLGADYWKFWTGQTISHLGSSFTFFALPLLTYKLTGSAFNLSLTAVATFLPFLLFGLVIGALVDRADRKRLMIFTDLTRTVIVATIPLLASFGLLAVWWIYIVAFIQSTLSIFFDSAEFASIPSLVDKDDLVTANGRIQASYSGAKIVGPLLAGALLLIIPLPTLLIGDALSFLISVCSLLLIRRSFNAEPSDLAGGASEAGEPVQPKSIYRDIVEGLRYIFGHPVLRNLSIMMAIFNFVYSPVFTQLVLFARVQFQASATQISWIYSIESMGVIVFSILAGRIRKQWSFSVVALGSLMLMGLMVVLLAFIHWYWIGAVIWAISVGLTMLYNINDASMRQSFVPNQMLGRVITVENVISFSAIPLGSFLGGLLIQLTNNVVLIYASSGILIFLTAFAFIFTALGHANRYLPQPEAVPVVK